MQEDLETERELRARVGHYNENDNIANECRPDHLKWFMKRFKAEKFYQLK